MSFAEGALSSPAAQAGEIAVENPYTGECVGTAPRQRAGDLDGLVAAAGRAVGVLAPEDRATILHAAAGRLAERGAELARLIASEAGTCIRESLREVDRACGNLATAAEEALRLHGEALQIPGSGGRRFALTVHEPVGVVGAITPYNRPLNQVVVKVAPALAAGNAVIVKPSERTPLSARAFERVLADSGLPAGAMAVVTGDPAELGPALASHPGVAMVTFTGSVATGHAVARAAAGKPTTLELGGNDPLIVLEDGDLALAARIAADQAFATAGQSCRGVKRVIAAARIADELVERIAEHAAAKRCGDPLDPRTEIGPMIDADAAERVLERCRRAVRDGALLVAGGTRDRALHAPTVLDRVPADAELVVEETFGPVAPVIRVADDEEAVRVANATRYGLQAGVITTSLERFMRIARRLRVGAVNFMDGPAFDSPHIPFGGVKSSGVGREGIRWSMREMTTTKTLTLTQPAMADAW